jgi:hypothetical protein
LYNFPKNVLSVNFRLESVIGGNPRDVRVVARSEALLLKTYGADIPNPVGDEVNGEVDSVSVDILKKFQPVVLEDVYPARVAADGNCLYKFRKYFIFMGILFKIKKLSLIFF